MNRAELFSAVAQILGGTAQPGHENAPDGWHSITLEDGTDIFATGGGYSDAGRLRFSGNYPRWTDAEGNRHTVTPRDIWHGAARLNSPEITVSDQRTPEQIAKDIERRLLPELREVWAACKRKCDVSEQGSRQRAATCVRVAKLTGGNVNHKHDAVSFGYEVGEAKYCGGFGSDDGESFDVTLRGVTEAQLLAILNRVKQ